MICPECGQANAAAAQFCTTCGQLLTAAVPSAAPASAPSASGEASPVGHGAPSIGVERPIPPQKMVVPPLPAAYSPKAEPAAASAPRWSPLPSHSPAYPLPLPGSHQIPLPGSHQTAYLPPVAVQGRILPVASGFMQTCCVCGTVYGNGYRRCPRCDTPTGLVANPNDPTCTTFLLPGALPAASPPPNSSGQKGGAIPREAQGLCWGPWLPLLTPFWCAASGLPLGLLLLVPLGLGLVWPILWMINLVAAAVFGIKGRAWAWQRRHFQDVAEFLRVQRIWGRWAFGLSLVLGAVLGLWLAVVSAFPDSWR